MKKSRGKIVVFLLILAMCIQTTGCNGSLKTVEDGSGKETNVIYQGEYQKSVLSDGEWIGAVCAGDDSFFYVRTSYDEKEDIFDSRLCAMSYANKEIREFNTQVGNGNSAVSVMTMDQNKNLVALVYDYEGEKESTKIEIISTEKDTLLQQYDITEMLSEEEELYIQFLEADKDNNIYFSDGAKNIWILNQDGKLINTIKLNNYLLQDMSVTGDGRVVCAGYQDLEGGQSAHAINVIEPMDKNIGKVLENTPPITQGVRMDSAGDKELLINNEASLFLYNMDSKKYTELMDFTKSNIAGSEYKLFRALDNGTIVAFSDEYVGEKYEAEFAFFTEKEETGQNEKVVLTLGATYVDDQLRKAVVEFNAKSDDCRVEIKDYGTEDYTSGIEAFNNDLLMGRAPDLFSAGDGVTNLKRLASLNLVEDLTPYLEKDPDIYQEDYFQSVLESCTIDGILCAIPNSFTISTCMGRTSQVGSVQGWTMEDMEKVLGENPQIKEIYTSSSKQSIMNSVVRSEMNYLIDWKNKTCSFSNEEFVKILEFADKYGLKEENDLNDATQIADEIKNGQLLLLNTAISSILDYHSYQVLFGEPITLIGYPVKQGTGSSISGWNSFAINSQSENKEAAWKFIKSIISREYYENHDVWGFPTLISAYDKLEEQSTTPEYEQDTEGNQIEKTKGTFIFGTDVQFDIYAVSKEEAHEVRQLIENTNTTRVRETDVMKIVEEETPAFFAGQKSAQETAEVIQNRVQTYINENS